MYIVETRMLNSWENCWLEDGKPMEFATKEDAEAEILETIEDSEMLEEPFILTDFRITRSPNDERNDHYQEDREGPLPSLS